MPARVPEYNEFNVMPQQLPGVRLDSPYRAMQLAGMGMAQQEKVGQEVASAGAALNNIATAQQIQQNESDAKEAHAATLDNVSQILNDPDTGYLQRRGQDAISTTDDTIQAIKKAAQAAVDNAPNDATRRMVQAANMQTLPAAIESVRKHAAVENFQYQLDASRQRQVSAGDLATKSYDITQDTPLYKAPDPDNPDAPRSLYQQQLATVRLELQTQADRMGLKDDIRDNYINDGMAKVYGSTVAHLANIGQTQNAKQFLTAASSANAMPQDMVDKLSKALDIDSTKDNALRYSDTLFATVKGEKAQLSKVQDDFESGNLTADERTLVESRIEHRAAKAKQDENEWVANALGQAQDFILKNPGASVTDLPPAIYRALEAKGHLAAVDSFAQRENKTPPDVYHDVVQNFGTGGANDITHMSDAEWKIYKTKLSYQDQRHFDAERAQAINGTPASRDDPGNINITGFKDALAARLHGLNVDLAKDADKEYTGALQQYAAEWVRNDQMSTGHRFNQAETAQSLDRLFATQVQFRNTFLGFDRGAGSARMLGMRIGDLPGDAADGIKKALQANGNPNPSDQDILLTYWRLHGNGKR